MVDTIRNVGQLQSLLADNITGDISAQDVRDFLVSALGVYGEIYVANAAIAQATGVAPAKLTAFDTNGLGVGTTPDHTQDRITIPTPESAGVYLGIVQLAYTGTANTTFDFEIYLNGVGTGRKFTRRLGAAADIGSGSVFGLVTLASLDFVEVWVSTPAGAASITVEDGQLILVRVA